MASLTAAQLSTFKTDIEGNANQTVVDALAGGSNNALTDWYNTQAADFWVFKKVLTRKQVVDNMDWSTDYAAYSSKDLQAVEMIMKDGYAPEQRHVKHSPQSEPQDFRLKPGRLVRSRVVDQGGEGIPGLCVVLNRWHTHTDSGGYFHWSVENPPPEQVDLKVYKRYSGKYESLEANVVYVDLARQPIILKKRE